MLSQTLGNPSTVKITASGKTQSQNWSAPELRPIVYTYPPTDGVYDYDFVAKPPAHPGPAHPTAISTDLTLDHIPDGMKGVRVHSMTNAIEKTLLPPPAPPGPPTPAPISPPPPPAPEQRKLVGAKIDGKAGRIKLVWKGQDLCHADWFDAPHDCNPFAPIAPPADLQLLISKDGPGGSVKVFGYLSTGEVIMLKDLTKVPSDQTFPDSNGDAVLVLPFRGR
jgi:hypothetical protein